MELNFIDTNMNFYNFINSGLSKYSEFEKQLKTCEKAIISNIGDSETPIYRATINPNIDKSIYIIGCIHGNEPAGTTGILHFMQKSNMPKKIRLEIIPLLNTSGFINNTRNNLNDIDINRDFCKPNLQPETTAIMNLLKDDKPELLWTLHEDASCDDFYLYYSNEEKLYLWKKIVDFASNYFPIRNKKIHGDECDNGLISHPSEDKISKHPKHKCSIENKFYNMGINYLTTETPCNASLAKRTLCNRKMLEVLFKNYA